MDVAIKPDLEAAVIAKLTRRLLPFLFLLYIVAYLDRINVGFAALQMQKQFGFSDAVYGLGAGVFFAGYFFFQVPSNLALARVGPRRWIAALMVVWGAISSAMVFISGPRSFYALRFLLGAAEAGFFPGMILYLKNWFPARARARAVALFMTAGPIAGVVGGPISGALLGLHSQHISGAQWPWFWWECIRIAPENAAGIWPCLRLEGRSVCGAQHSQRQPCLRSCSSAWRCCRRFP